MQTWADVGIPFSYGATGEVRTTCPQCSPTRQKSRVACLAVNVDKGTWLCHHCGWKGGLQGPHVTQEWAVVSRPPIQLDARKRAALRRVWGEAYPLTANDPVLSYLYQRGIARPRSVTSLGFVSGMGYSL